jgi:hypothetical protein
MLPVCQVVPDVSIKSLVYFTPGLRASECGVAGELNLPSQSITYDNTWSCPRLHGDCLVKREKVPYDSC